MSLAIETDDLTKDFLVGFWRPRPYRALDRLTLRVEQGEIFGFLGPNGAGKSTTIKLLMQLIYPTSGQAPRVKRIAPSRRVPGRNRARRRRFIRSDILQPFVPRAGMAARRD